MTPSGESDTGRAFAATDVYDELFSNEFDTSWVVKSERTPTAKAACDLIERMVGEPISPRREACRLRRARIEWRDAEGWWLTVDDAGEFEVWEVDAA